MKIFRKIIFALMCITIIVMAGCSAKSAKNSENTVYSVPTHDGYTLKKMVILSRHNIRSPLSGEGSALASVTKSQWFKWTSAKSELSLRGGVLETEMGQFFRKYVVANGLMKENALPSDKEVRIYANSMQRTISTANYFKSGFLPISDIKTEHHCTLNTMDPVFHPQFTYLSEAFKEQAIKEINALGGSDKLEDLIVSLTDNYRLLEKVLDFANSDYAKENGLKEFPMDAPEVIFEMNAEPHMTGTLNLLGSISDALVLQYYEEPDAFKAGFGHNLTNDEWKLIADINDTYQEAIFAAHSIAENVAHPMLKEIKNEIDKDGRIFTFLCGHDSNILTVLKSLGVEKYNLPGAISKNTPIGAKLVFEIWENAQGEQMVCINLVYQSVEQLRSCQMLTMENPPVFFPLSFKGITKNADGFYSLNDFEKLLSDTIAEYDNLPSDVQNAA